jgi:type IV pilus assembly protein PilY1
MDVDNATHSLWKLFNLANVTSPRKFLYPPEFVLTRDFTAVLVGSGDREKPLKLTGVDRFYMFKDKKTGKDATGMVAISGDDTASNNMVDITGQSSPPSSTVTAALASSSNNGWFYEFVAGEKVVNAPLVAGPVVYFSTNKPTPVIDGTCTANLGEAKAYGLLFTNGTPGRDTNADGLFTASDAFVLLPPLTGLPPSPVGGLVNVLDSATNTNVIVPFIIGSGGTSAPPSSGGGSGSGSGTCTGSGCIVCPIHMVPSSIGGSMVCLQPDPRRKKSYWYFKSDQ